MLEEMRVYTDKEVKYRRLLEVAGTEGNDWYGKATL